MRLELRKRWSSEHCRRCDNEPDNGELTVCADAEKTNTVGNQTHQSRTDKDTRHCADTAAQRAASEYGGGDGVSMPPLMITSP